MRSGDLGEHVVIDLFAAFGVAPYILCRLTRLPSLIFIESKFMLMDILATSILTALLVGSTPPCLCRSFGTVFLRAPMQRFVSLLPAPSEQRLFRRS